MDESLQTRFPFNICWRMFYDKLLKLNAPSKSGINPSTPSATMENGTMISMLINFFSGIENILKTA